MPSSHPAIQGASKRNTVRGRFEFPKQTNAEKLEGFLGRVVNQLMLDWAVESGGIRWKTSLWRSPLSHHTTTQTESPPPGPTEPIATRLVRFGRRNSLLSVLICIKGVTSIGPHSPFRILRKGGKVDSDDESLNATEQQDNTQPHRSLESHYTTSTYTLIWQAPSLGVAPTIWGDEQVAHDRL